MPSGAGQDRGYDFADPGNAGRKITGKTGRAVEERWLAYSRARMPMSRLGLPDDVANAALFLASDEASHIDGENPMVDGGWMVG